jgi:putative CocE/NonD family hydrolase
VKLRDGVVLAMTVRLPAGKTLEDGPFPTFIEYSGYQVAAPHDLLPSITSGTFDPLAPASSTAVGSLIGPLLDFAVVSVQMRGSGCSGGAFDLFDLPTTYDGYDAVEAVAAQSWVKGGKVGMGGISFSGITQLFTAGTQPPHLAAIAPLSVTDDIYTGTGSRATRAGSSTPASPRPGWWSG